MWSRDQRAQLSRRMEAFDEAWRAGDIDGQMQAVAQNATGAVRLADAQSRRWGT